jgi:hypothetical protein
MISTQEPVFLLHDQKRRPRQIAIQGLLYHYISQEALDLSPLNQSGKAFKGPVKGGLDIIGKTACWQLPHSEMVCDTLAAHALPRTRLIGAVTFLDILFLFTLHGSTSTQRDSYCTYGLNLVILLGLKTNGYLLPGIH